MNTTTLTVEKAIAPYLRQIDLLLLQAQAELGGLARRELFATVGNLVEGRLLDEQWRLGRSFAADPREHQLT